MRVCITCDDGEVSDKSRTGACLGCQSSLSYWKKKSPARVVLRRKRLSKYQTRLATWFDKDGKREKEKARGQKPSRPRNATTH